MTAKTHGRVFEIPSYRYDAIFKPTEQLLEPMPAAAKPAAAKPVAAQPAAAKSGPPRPAKPAPAIPQPPAP